MKTNLRPTSAPSKQEDFSFALPCWQIITTLSCLTMMFCGCGKANDSYPLTGTVLIDEKAEPGVYLTLKHSVTSDDQTPVIITAVTDKEGRFSTTAPTVGQYSVQAFWPSTIMDEGIPMEGPDQFNGKYRKEGTIPEATVTADGTEIETVHLNTAD